MQRNTTPLLVLILMAIGISLRSTGDAPVPMAPNAPQPKTESKRGKTGGSAIKRSRPMPEGLRDVIWSYFGDSEPPADASFNFLVVAVPDPAASQFTYMFDAFAESIQRAAAESEYTFDRFWLPWERPKAEQAEKSSEEQEEQSRQRRQEPGMMLFRGPELLNPLVVFLIGESPTAGLNKAAFSNALKHMQELNGGQFPKQVRLVGPTFSGSIPSLRLAIHAARQQRKDISFRIVTGSATNAANADEIRQESVDYKAVIENDSFARERLYNYLQRQDVDDRFAILSEFGTSFGQNFGQTRADSKRKADLWQTPMAPVGPPPLILSFPIQIARLRNAYQDDPELRVLWSGQAEKTPRQGLDLKLKDAGSPPDRIPAFSLDQTPLWQEITFSNIAVAIRRERIQAVMIAATDILDAVFVTRLIQKNCPDVRIFTMDADLLYQHSSPNLSFYGMMMVTTYPLFSANQLWQAPGGVPRLIPFANQASQGVYNACRALLRPPQAASEKLPLEPSQVAKKKLLEYSHPARPEAATPPLWLTVVGRDGFWPVRLLADGDQSEQKESSLAPFSPLPRASAQPLLGRPPVLWYVGFWLLTSIYLWHFGHVVYLAWPSKSPKKIFPVYIELPDNRHGECLVYLVFGLVAISAAYLPLVNVQYHYLSHAADTGGLGVFTLRTAGVVSALLLVFMAAWIVRLWAWKGWVWSISAVVLVTSTLGAYVVAWQQILSPAGAGNTDALFFTFRSLFPANGVCPVLPIVLVMSGLAIWAFTHLQGIRLREVRLPGWPDIEAADARFCGMGEYASLVQRFIADFPLRPRALGIITVAVLVAAGALSILYVDVHGLESRPFDRLFLIAACVLYFLVALEVVRFACVWLSLSGVLRRLAWHPICEAFSRLAQQHPDISSQAIWHRGGQKHSYATLALSADRLKVIAKWFPCPAMSEIESDLQHVLDAEAKRYREQPKLFEGLYARLNAIAEALPASGLARYWRGEDPEAGLTEKQEFVDRIRAAEDFVALRFAAFIRYANFQLRNLLDFISSGFLLLLLALVTYPFQPHRTLILGISILFLLIAAGVLFVFYQMDREAVLSRLSGTEPGKLSRHFFLSALTRGAVPLGTLLVSQFPELGRFVLTVLDPVLRAVQ